MQTKQLLQIGSRVHCGLYGGRDGIVYAIHGEQRPASIQSLGGGCVVTGGNADFDIVFEDGHLSLRLPECIIHGVQWNILDGIATPDEIQTALQFAEAEKIRSETEQKLQAEARAKARAELLAKYGDWLTPVGNGHGGGQHAAKNIRKQLKKEFPNVKFSVTSDYNSLRVAWAYGPTAEAVSKITDLYRDGHFDGMTDCYEHNPDAVWSQVFGHVQYPSCSRSFDDALTERVARDLCVLQKRPYVGLNQRDLCGEHDTYYLSDHVHQLLYRTEFPVGTEYAGVEYAGNDAPHWVKAIVKPVAK